MKRIVSISLGSSTRDHRVETEILGQPVIIERIGTNGDLGRAISLLKELDGSVDAFGIGGIDIHIRAGNSKYFLRDGKKMAQAVHQTPIVDGGGLKDTLERKVISYLHTSKILSFTGKKVLLVCAVDRFGMAEEMIACGGDLVMGDLIFGLGLPVPIRSMKTLERLARVIAPAISLLPTKFIYPSGGPEKEPNPNYAHYYQEAEIIAGDYHYIKRHLPKKLEGKIIITNTVTARDVDILQQVGISKLITTTPELNGRSFGTNVMEALLVSYLDKDFEDITADDYSRMLDELGFVPRIEELNPLKIDAPGEAVD